MVKILVVDDEQRIREMIRKYAEYEGFAVDEACDGLEAVDKAMKENYDLIVMDITMELFRVQILRIYGKFRF